MHKYYTYYKNFRPFTDIEAWQLFRLAAICEAVGWTLLIIGIICKHIPFTGNEVPVQIAGRVHGMLFLVYVVAAVVLAPSLRWSLFRTVLATAFSVPPYGSIIFEQAVAQERAVRSGLQLRTILLYRRLVR